MKTKMNLGQLTLLTSLTMLGSGFVMFPAQIHEVGAMSSLSWVISAIGAALIAYCFAKCSFYSKQQGGLGGFAYYSFGDAGAFFTNFCYGICLLIANVAIAIATLNYFTAIFHIVVNQFFHTGITILLIIISIVACLKSPRFVGQLSVLFALCILIPTVVMNTVGWESFHVEVFKANWNPQNLSLWESVEQTMGLTLWSFLGLESACANSESVVNPEKNVPRAVLISTFLVGGLYIFSIYEIAGLIPSEMLLESSAPMSLIFNYIFNHYAGEVASFMLALSCFGGLLSWQFTMAMVFRSLGKQGFLPEVFAKCSSTGVPVIALCFLGIIQIFLCILVNEYSPFNRFVSLVNDSVFLNLVPYILCISALPRILQVSGVMNKEKFAIFSCILSLSYIFFVIFCLPIRSFHVGTAVVLLILALWGFVCVKKMLTHKQEIELSWRE